MKKALHRTTLLLLLFFAGLTTGQAQELRCVVNVQAPTVGSDQQVYSQIQEQVTKYMNLRKWSDQVYLPHERIDCNIQIIINDRPEVDQFRASIQVIAKRPAYNATYETLTINIQDKDFDFSFVPFEPLLYSENTFEGNLASVLNFYAYIILGLDADSFELKGGSPFFEKAKNVVNISANNGYKGWQAQDGVRSRFALSQDLLDNSLRSIHNVYYNYHRNGIDMLEKDVNRARAEILKSLKELQQLNMRYPNKFIVRQFLSCKQNELVSMYQNALVTEKRQLLSIMESLDPGNMNEYQKINQTK